MKNFDIAETSLYTRCLPSHYRSPTKLWEGNVFSHVCLSFFLSSRRMGAHVTSAWTCSNLFTWILPHPHSQPWPWSSYHIVTPPGPSPQSCSNMLIWNSPYTYPVTCLNLSPPNRTLESRWVTFYERNNSYYFSRANQQKEGTKIYSLTPCSLTVNECDWHISAGNDERVNSHCLIRKGFFI